MVLTAIGINLILSVALWTNNILARVAYEVDGKVITTPQAFEVSCNHVFLRSFDARHLISLASINIALNWLMKAYPNWCFFM